ncbi:MAG: adenine phosphoribosyltransferase [Clostridiales bacterium]|jgi:adenine phosphoribosyltransferase|nr:adenine phosphoribosyltransferase [Clostridiales bacterium]
MRYTVDFYGIKRALPICPIDGGVQIAAFNMLGDNELVKVLAEEAYKKIAALDFDAIVTAECKGIAFAQEVSRLLYERKNQRFFVAARKSFKLYMNEPLSVTVRSITTGGEQTLWLSKDEADKLRGGKVIIADDVISTGGTADALRTLLGEVGAGVAAELCVFAEGAAVKRKDIIYLKYLPLFDRDGTAVEQGRQDNSEKFANRR